MPIGRDRQGYLGPVDPMKRKQQAREKLYENKANEKNQATQNSSTAGGLNKN